jgi:hypothetical protein
MFVIRPFRILAVAAAAISLVPSIVSASPAHKRLVRPDYINLRPADMPGYSLVAGRFWNNADASQNEGIPVGQYVSHGRVISYETLYELNGNTVPSSGIIIADAVVSEYGTPAGATWEYNTLSASFNQALQQAGITPTSVPGLGTTSDAAHGYVTLKDSKGKPFQASQAEVFFVRGNYRVTLVARGVKDQLNFNAVWHLASVIDHHIISPPSRTVAPPASSSFGPFRPRP